MQYTTVTAITPLVYSVKLNSFFARHCRLCLRRHFLSFLLPAGWWTRISAIQLVSFEHLLHVAETFDFPKEKRKKKKLNV